MEVFDEGPHDYGKLAFYTLERRVAVSSQLLAHGVLLG